MSIQDRWNQQPIFVSDSLEKSFETDPMLSFDLSQNPPSEPSSTEVKDDGLGNELPKKKKKKKLVVKKKKDTDIGAVEQHLISGTSRF